MEEQMRSSLFNRGERILLGAFLVSVIFVAALSVWALFAEQGGVISISGSSIGSTSLTRLPFRTISERQLVITAGILAAVTGDGTRFYTWTTTLRSTTRSFVVSIKAVLLIGGGPPIEQTHFFVLTSISFGVLGPNTPLNFNQTATSESVNLTPPTPGFFQNGLSFPEIVTVVLRNGTSYFVQTTAPVSV
ncbi:MAG: hypothetical protein OK422_02005 [Thaumarchaeota archaeon]|nr:hypothetical protein [Nitrososphaerota archaeon]